MSRFIAGVYSYCDRWCERCRLQARCRVHRDLSLMEAAIARGEPESTVSRLMREQYDEDQRAEAAERGPVPASVQLEWNGILEVANQPIAPDELDAIDRAEERVRRQVHADPLSIACRDLDEMARGVAAALTATLATRDDPVLRAALDTIGRFAWLLPAKVHRALSGLMRADTEEEDDGLGIDDANGTAKLVRLVLSEAREAWVVVRESGLGNGAPQQLIERIDALDARMAARFPRAMWFVRPGFDEGA